MRSFLSLCGDFDSCVVQFVCLEMYICAFREKSSMQSGISRVICGVARCFCALCGAFCVFGSCSWSFMCDLAKVRSFLAWCGAFLCDMWCGEVFLDVV